MNQAIKELWLAALRSGKYKQGRSQLRRGDSWCCLGVLCDLATKQGIGEWDGVEFIVKAGDEVLEVVSQVPSCTVQMWAELDAPNPLIGEEEYSRLATLNDGSVSGRIRPHTFTQIADLIEAHL